MRLSDEYRWPYVPIEEIVLRFLLEEVTEPATQVRLREALAEPKGELDVRDLPAAGRREVLHALAKRLVPAALDWFAEDPDSGVHVGTMKELWLMSEDILRQKEAGISR